MGLFYSPYRHYLEVQPELKLHFCTHIGYIFSQFIRMLILICIITYSFSNLDSLLILYLTMVRPKLEYASNVWNSVTSTNVKKLEHIQWKFVALCQYCLFTRDHGTYEDFLKSLNLYTLHNRRLYLDVLFLISVHSGLKFCLSLLDTTGIQVLPFNFRNSCLFTATCHN